MKKITTVLAAAALFTVGLVSCQKDDADVTILSPVAGNFIGGEACPPTPTTTYGKDDYAIDIYNQANSNSGKVFIGHIHELDNVYEATVSGNTITLPASPYEYDAGTATKPDIHSGTVSATGKVEGSKLTLNFTLTGTDAAECVFVGDRDGRHQ